MFGVSCPFLLTHLKLEAQSTLCMLVTVKEIVGFDTIVLYPNLRLVLKWNVNSKLHFCFISSFICYCYKNFLKTHDNWMDLNLIFRQTGSAWKGFRCYLGKVHFKKENLIADQSNLYSIISSFFQIMTQLVRSSSLTV